MNRVAQRSDQVADWQPRTAAPRDGDRTAPICTRLTLSRSCFLRAGFTRIGFARAGLAGVPGDAEVWTSVGSVGMSRSCGCAALQYSCAALVRQRLAQLVQQVSPHSTAMASTTKNATAPCICFSMPGGVAHRIHSVDRKIPSLQKLP
jgi:hypothetical protein